ncbi:hypothetical protein AB0H43_11795 [Hamadaea sp. NPDC050747]|uniref:hypothetical protein n=1 Tax=Hamadaea sp. NPDC050747 TaxID=3155789 RepID=UPI0033D2F8BD
MFHDSEGEPLRLNEPLLPRWDLGDGHWLYIGDEVALLSPLTAHGAEAYGRIIGLDPEGSGRPLVLVLSGLYPGTVQAPIGLGDILGKRVRSRGMGIADVDRPPERTGGGREDRTWSGGLRHDRHSRQWL